MPFRLTNVPVVFQHMMNAVLSPLCYRVALVHMNNVLIPPRDFQKGIERLEEVRRTLQNVNITLYLSKCKFMASGVTYLRFGTPSGMRPSKVKVKAVTGFSYPTNVHEL